MLTASWLRAKNIWVAYSGGVDSHVLLHMAVKAFPNVRAIHIHHGLSPNADTWQQHCAQVCIALNVPLQTIRVNAKPMARQSPEDAARKARRKAWQDLLTANDVLLVAHHADDQAETILYRLFRGTGPKGLAGMQARSKIGAADLFRPLLTTSKKTILNYAQQENLRWITDESNTNISYDRNFLRQQVIPLVAKRWPAVNTNINRAGDLCNQLVNFVAPIIAEKLITVYGSNTTELDLTKLQQYSGLLQSEILRAWLQQHGVIAELKQLNLLYKQVINAKIDANPQFVLGDKIIRRSNNKLYILDRASTVVNNNFACEWDLQTDLLLPNGQYLTVQSIAAQPALAAHLQQAKVLVKLGGHGEKAKKIFQKLNVPAWERASYPLLFADGRLVSIVGLWSRF